MITLRFTILAACLVALTNCTPSVIKVSANQANEELAAMPVKDWSFSKSARSKIRKAYQIHQFQPEHAATLFLHAAHELEPYKKHSQWAKKSYQHALGMGVDLVHNNHYWGKSLSHDGFTITLPQQIDQPQFHELTIDELHYAGRYETPALEPAIMVSGEGAPMVSISQYSKTTAEKHPFIAKTGYLQASTVKAHWTRLKETEMRLAVKLLDPRKNKKLAANYSAPVALYDQLTNAMVYSGISNVYRPTKGLEHMGLYSSAPVDPDRIPIVFVHGLAASPNLWLEPIHELLRNPGFREKYQIFVFFYPTGFPIPQNATTLKKELQVLQKIRLEHHKEPQEIVLVGHSMGGLLTSMVTRDFSGEYDKIYKVELEKLKIPEISKETVRILINKAPIDFISTVIFLGTPHRGSPIASNWIGRSTSHLISIPKSFLEIDPSSYQHDFSQFGKSLWDINHDLDGIYNLEPNHPLLVYTVGRPKIDGVSYHSIIGDRGWDGDLEESSDGLVPYKSSHISNAESELVIPAWHNLQDHDETIAEILRILEL